MSSHRIAQPHHVLATAHRPTRLTPAHGESDLTRRVCSAGQGCCWNYDAIGSFEERPYSATGSASEIVQPLLDNRVEHQHVARGVDVPALDLAGAQVLARDAMSAACERDIQTGDFAEIVTMVKGSKPKIQRTELKFD